jgi:hypothetical protein
MAWEKITQQKITQQKITQQKQYIIKTKFRVKIRIKN